MTSRSDRTRLHALLPAEVADMLDQLAEQSCTDRTTMVVGAIIAAWEREFPAAAERRRRAATKEAARG